MWKDMRLGPVSKLGFSLEHGRCAMLGKTLLTKKAQEKSLTSIEQSLMAGPNCQSGQGKDGAARSLGEEWLL
jgi:hypothetical protein